MTGVVRSSSGAPSAGVRVYAVRYRDAVEAEKSPPALDSLTVTDAAGKYRLEIPPGRYHIASGSVAAPTYFPGTTEISAARVISVAADEVVPGIDFGSFIPANRNPTGVTLIQQVPPGNGVLSGVLRYPDGKPAAGVRVVAVPASAAGSNAGVTVTSAGAVYFMVGAQMVIGSVGGSAWLTDSNGAFRLEGVRADTHYLAAGFAEAPVFYPGTTDIAKAKTITTTNTSKIDALDFTVPPTPPGVTISGKIMTSSGVPATGAGVRLRSQGSSVPAAGAFGLPIRNAPKETIVAADGLFSFTDVAPGAFTVETMYSGASQLQNVVVTGQPVNFLEFILPIALVSGRILMEDGSPVPNPQIFSDAIVTTVNNPNIISSTIFPITSNGTFTRLHEGGEFRFYLRVLPEEYEIKSMKFGDADLTRETLKITGNVHVDVEIRVGRRMSPPSSSEVRVSGTALDGATGLPAGERVTLCCRNSGPFERLSTPLRADGSFEFAAVPPDKYTPGIQLPTGKPNVYVVENVVEVGAQGLIGLALNTTLQFGQVTATIMADGNVPLPATVLPSVVFVAGRVRVVAQRTSAGMYIASLPMGVKYAVSLENLPEGYGVKSIVGDATPVVTTNVLNTTAAPVVILIERK